ncbi:MAG: cytochrome c oxidase subunit II transmembrane domain-containing protein, partial [Planctomyces sp.]
MKKFWALFFWFWPLVALYVCLIAPGNNWWFPSKPLSTMGHQIDGLFYLILIIVTVTFIGTEFALGYALWKSATKEPGQRAWFSHGSPKREVIWTIVPAVVLVCISLPQWEVLA